MLNVYFILMHIYQINFLNNYFNKIFKKFKNIKIGFDNIKMYVYENKQL